MPDERERLPEALMIEGKSVVVSDERGWPR